MGQQQLILLIIVFIIVGIATITAINTFENSSDQTNKESIKLMMIDVVGYAKAYYLRPISLGGGGGSFENISLNDVRIDSMNEHGIFSISDISNDSFTITAIPAAGGDNIVGVVYADSIEFVDP